MSSPPPRMLGRYALYQKIASGGMASVHVGRLVGPVGFARTVAIKRMHPQFAEDPDFVSMFLDEARLAARIRHPNVVATMDVVAMEGELFLVMEFIQGESLARLVKAATRRQERIPPAMTATIMVGVLHGLHAAHEATNDRGEPLEVVHRDVSPQNVLVGVDGVSRVLDFGVAKAVGRLATTREGELKGKLAYMAPEQLDGTVSRVTDVYAASVVLWEALTGTRLFQGENDAHVFGMVRKGCHEPPSKYSPDVPPMLDEVTMRGLSVDPAKRFATAREMACALEDAIPLVGASKISAWIAEAAKESLEQRSAMIAGIESDSSSLSNLEAAPPSKQNIAVDIPIDVTGDESLPTQLSSGSMSSHGRIVVPSAKRPPTWLVASGALLLLGGAVAIGARIGRGSAAAPVVSASAPLFIPAEVPVPTPLAASSSAPAPAPVVSEAPPPKERDSTPTPVAPAVAAAPARAVSPTPVSPTPVPPRVVRTCDPPYTINAAGHHVRKPECH